MKNALHFHDGRIKILIGDAVFLVFYYLCLCNLEFIFHYIIIHNITLANIELY